MVPNEYPLPAARARLLELEMAIRDLRPALSGRYGLLVEDLHSRMTLSIGGDEAYPAKGSYHLTICLYAFTRAAEGQLNLDEEVEYLPEDRTAGAGPLQSATFGSRFAIRQLCQYAVVDRDPIARRMLERTLGEAAVRGWLQSIGGRQTTVGMDSTSAADTVTCLKYLLAVAGRQPLLGGTILEWMCRNRRVGAAKFLPDEVRAAQSTDFAAHMIEDAGIVFLPKAPYVVSLLADTAPSPDVDEVLEQFARVGKLVYDHLAAMAGTFVGLTLDGARLVTRLPVALLQGEPVGPVAEIAGAVGAEVQTDAVTQAITLQRGGHRATITPGDAHLQTEADARTLAVTPFVFEGAGLAPLIPVCTALGLHADWDPDCNRLALTSSAST